MIIFNIHTGAHHTCAILEESTSMSTAYNNNIIVHTHTQQNLITKYDTLRYMCTHSKTSNNLDTYTHAAVNNKQLAKNEHYQHMYSSIH